MYIKFLLVFGRRIMRRHGSSQSGCSNISLLDELTDSIHAAPLSQTNVNSLPLPLPEMDAESNIEDERLPKLSKINGQKQNMPRHVVMFEK